jgi:cytoskeleton protein RodZ
MVESVGKKLSHAREQRGLSLEEAAMHTRIRAPQLAALEADDYASFGSNTYARGFLLIYGKFLGVEVGPVARQLEGANPISLSDYQYLNAVAEEDERTLRAAARSKSAPSLRPAPQVERRRPSLAPLIAFVLLLAAGGYGFHLWLQAERLTPAAATATPTPTAPGMSVPPDAPATSIVAPTAVSTVQSATPAPAPTPAPTPRADDRAFLSTLATPPPVVAPPPAPATPQIHELVIEPLKKTWVRIRRDDPTSEPIFDDVMYPKVGPLKLKGTRFWVEIHEPDSLSLRKNGQLLVIQPPGAVVQ